MKIEVNTHEKNMIRFAAEHPEVLVMSADLGSSCEVKKFRQTYPDRYLTMGIAEQNMIDVAAGLALTGHVAYTGSFAVFGTGRAYDQIRNTVCYSNLDVKICPTHAGVSVGPDGGSHQMLEDVSLMRGLPGMRVLVPADYAAARAALRLAAARLIQPEGDYMPLIFDDSFVLYDEDRLRTALKWLKKAYPGQIIIFTCHQREAQMMTAEQIAYRLVTM